ncbi:MoaD/ThiS family protein [Chloroflexota bacterium]
MPSFKIQLVGPITHFVGEKELDIQAEEGATLSDIFTEVGRDYGEIVKKKIVTPEGDFHPYILASVNGTDISELDGINTQLKEGDGILIALIVVGG